MLPRKIFFLISFLGLFILLDQNGAMAAESALPPEAERAFAKAMTAVDQKQWDIAERYFLEAGKTAPFSPKVLFNLGLINEQRGREVLAAFWFRAFLESAPETPNKQKAKAEINKISVQIEATATKLINEALSQADLLPDVMSLEKQNVLEQISYIDASLGKIEDAVALAKRAGDTNATDDVYRSYYGKYQVGARDLEGAKETLNQIKSDQDKNELISEIAGSELANEEPDAAFSFIKRMSAGESKTKWLEKLAAFYIGRFEIDKAEALLTELKTPEEKIGILSLAMRGRLREGKIDVADRYAREIVAAAETSEEVKKRFLPEALSVLGKETEALQILENKGAGPTKDSQTLYSMAIILHSLGKPDQAKAVLNEISKKGSPDASDFENSARARILADEGNLNKALEAIEHLSDIWRSKLCETIFWELIWKNDLNQAEKVAAVLPSKPEQALYFYQLASTYVKKGDAANATRMIRKSYQLALDANSSKVLKKIYTLEKMMGDQDMASKVSLAARVMEWTGLATYFATFKPIVDLPGYLDEIKGKKLEQMPVETSYAAQNWATSLLYIQKSEKKLDQLKGDL